MRRPAVRLPAWARRRNTRRWASAVSLGMVAATLAVLAVRSDGQPVVDVSLNDGSVWVTNANAALVGRLNPAVSELDLGVEGAADVDVMQSAYDVLLRFTNAAQPAVKVLNVAAGQASSAVPLPAEASASFGGGTVAVTDPASGGVWVRTMETILGFTTKDTPSDLQTSPGSAVVVGVDGMVHAVDAERDQVLRATVGAAGVAEPQPALDLAGDLDATSPGVQATSVGRRPVVLDPARGELLTSTHGPVPLAAGESETARLQQPSISGGGAYLAIDSGLRLLDLDSGELSAVATTTGPGPAAAPVVVEGCVHSAWAVADAAQKGYFRLCEGDEAPLELTVPGIRPGAELVFRVNRDVVVLNDVRSGDSWFVRDDSLQRVDNWSDIDPSQGQKQEEDKEQQDDPDRTLQNIAPTANDDTGEEQLGARPGRATILPVTANDTDPNGDILTIDSFTPPRGADGASLSVVGKGTELQLDLPADAEGTVTFSYTIVDGAGGEPDDAEVSVRITPDDDNGLPVQRKPVDMTVGAGATRSVFVMPDWRDPDGDDMVLTSATVDGGGSVEFTADGMVTYVDDNSGPGTRTVDLTVSDGQDAEGDTGSGTVTVEVTDAKKLPPDLLPDRVVAQAGSDVLVKPLENDASPDGSELTLAKVTGSPDLSITPDPDTGTFSVRGDRPGAYYIDYRAFNDSGGDTSYIRLDLLPESQQNRAPVAVKDVGVLAGGDAVLVDLLQNDYDPDNDVLVVQTLEIPRDSGLKAVLIDKEQVRVEPTSELTRPVSITYTVSDGERSDSGRLQVLPGPDAQLNRPPIAEQDEVTVRAGSIASIPVLANDRDPDQDRLEIRQTDLDNPEELLLFASGARFRVRAPEKPGTYTAVYTVRDPDGATDSAQMVITVLPDTAESNRPPEPKPLVRRAFTGETLRVRLDTAEIDPDGDAVRITDIVEPPRLGRVVGYGLDYLDYQPRDGAVGTDTLRLTVEDAYGAQARTDVRIGVATRSPVNQPPVALDDQIDVRPGRTIQYAVTANDRDPDADPLSVTGDLRAKEGVEATTDKGFVTVTVPDTDEVSVQRVGYTVTDGLGGFSPAVLAVTGDPEAPLWAPRTRDDAVDPTKVLGLEPGATVEEDVLANDGDIDGLVSDLRLESVDPEATVGGDGSTLVVTVQRKSQVLAYRVTDADGQQSYGFVFVPGTDEIAPLVDPDVIPLEVDQGKSLRVIRVADVVLTRRGRTPTLTVKREVFADHSDGSPLVLDKDRLSYTPDPAYYGTDALTFEVTDGEGLNDPTGLLARLTVPIEIEPSENLPPTLRSTQTVVGQDEDTVLSLAGLADDPNTDDRDRLAFEVVKGDDRVLDWTVENGTLRLRATDAAEDGEEQALEIEVTDPAGASARATVAVQVTASAAPLVSVRPTEVVGVAGRTTTVDVGLLAVNPFPGEELVVSNPQVTAGSAETPTVDGTEISIVPRQPDSVVTVLYTVNDHLEEPSRAVTGRIRVSVLSEEAAEGGGADGGDGGEDGVEDPVVGVPDAPNRPTVVSVESGQVKLSWDQPADNGGAITGYVVTGGPGSTSCGSTMCPIGGLTNGSTYRFQVAAVNEAGTGPPSPPSDEVTPADLPAVMAAPRVTSSATERDKNLDLAWTAPDDGGSTITGYTVRETSTGAERTVGANQTSVEFGGLLNGDTYRFVVRAETEETRRTGRQQAFSATSEPAMPFGKPLVDDLTVTATSPHDGASGGVVAVEFGPANKNGSPVTDYRVQMFVNGAAESTRSVGPEPATTNFSVQNGRDYSFRVTAVNEAGESAPSNASNTVNPYGRASAPRNVRMASEGDHQATVRWDPAADDGGRPTGLQYRVSAGSQSTLVSGTSATLNGLPNSPTQVTVQTITYNDSAPIEGGADSTTVRPFGAPTSANVTFNRGNRAVTFYVNKDAAANGRPVERYRYRTRILEPGPSWSGWSGPTTTSDGAVTLDVEHGGNDGQIEVTPIANEGGEGATTVTTGTAAEKTVNVSRGARSGNGYVVSVSGTGFRSGSFVVQYRLRNCQPSCANPQDSVHSTTSGSWTIGARVYSGPGELTVTVWQPNRASPTIRFESNDWVGGWSAAREAASVNRYMKES